MIHLDLKPQDIEALSLSPGQSADVDRMETILANLGYDAPRAVLATAWERYSSDHYCMGWMPLGVMFDNTVADYLFEYLEPCTTQDV